MNPFDLRGPEFLLFYLAYGVAALIGAALVRRWRESGPPPRLDLGDPYLIAMLRGGRDEAIRVAIVSLVDRGLLAVNEELWRTTDAIAAASPGHPLERALIARFDRGGDRPSSIRTDDAIDAACRELSGRLEAQGLLAGPAIAAARARRAFVATAVILAPAAIKLYLAAQRGHANVQVLVILAVVFAIAGWALRGRRVTARGRRVLADLRGLVVDLERPAASIRPGGEAGELALLAAVFGLAALPPALVPPIPGFADPRASAGGDGGALGSASTPGGVSCGASGGSSGGSSCGSSGGASCGGGGCGGCGS